MREPGMTSPTGKNVKTKAGNGFKHTLNHGNPVGGNHSSPGAERTAARISAANARQETFTPPGEPTRVAFRRGGGAGVDVVL